MVTAGEEMVEQAATGNVAFAPLGIPLLAGPGAWAALLGLEGREADQALGVAGTVIGVLLICVAVYVCFRSGELIARRLGPKGHRAQPDLRPAGPGHRHRTDRARHRQPRCRRAGPRAAVIE
jgi:small neutral amino acid transporter SnatA (MarC family)